jgi:hypothetical protein
LDQNFDTGPIWQLIQELVNPEALAPDAYQKTSGYQSWLVQQTKPLTEATLPLQVTDKPVFRLAGWLLLLFFLAMAWLDWRAGELVMSPIAAFMALFGLYSLLQYGRTEVDAEGIKRTNPLTLHRIRWDEINQVEFYGEQRIAFRGKDKCLVIPGSVSMATTGRQEVLAYINAQILGRRLAIGQPSFWAISRNTKVDKQMRFN